MATPAKPPEGSLLADPTAQRIAVDKQLGRMTPDQTDPAFVTTGDPLNALGAYERAKTILRELPLIVIQHGWTVDQIRGALASHVTGVFWDSAQLADTMSGDDRVQATIGSRIGGLFGRPVRHTPSQVRRVKGSRAAKECYDAWTDNWERMAPEAALRELHRWDIMMGFGLAEPVWDTSTLPWIPELRVWHPAYSYYHWPLRRYVVVTMDGQQAVIPGDGKWILHAPYGGYRGWMLGALRAIAEPWAIRHFAIRDWARFSEVHGMPTRLGEVPAAAAPDERAYFEQQISNLGSAPAMILPKGVDGVNSYDYKLVEARDRSWDAFPGLRDHCDMAIVLAILFQNLTTEVKEGSFAAARVHGDVREGALQADNKALKLTLHQQLARPFAKLNFGDADLAPWTEWDITPYEDIRQQSQAFQAFGTAVEVLRRGGIQFKNPDDVRKIARNFGLKLPPIVFKDPVSGGLGGK